MQTIEIDIDKKLDELKAKKQAICDAQAQVSKVFQYIMEKLESSLNEAELIRLEHKATKLYLIQRNMNVEINNVLTDLEKLKVFTRVMVSVITKQ